VRHRLTNDVRLFEEADEPVAVLEQTAQVQVAPPLFQGVSEKALGACGLFPSEIQKVLNLRSENELLDLASHLPPAAQENLLNLYTGAHASEAPAVSRPATTQSPVRTVAAPPIQTHIIHTFAELAQSLLVQGLKSVIDRSVAIKEFSNKAMEAMDKKADRLADWLLAFQEKHNIK